jgi:glycosyltransferase involved in cell wall biosynthesis
LEIRERYDTPAESVVALFMGRLVDQKRPDRFLRVLAKATKNEPTLRGWLLGDGPQRHELERLARELRLDARVRFLGAHDEIASIIAAADVYVSTSDSEGIPAVVLETSYLGVPALSARVGGMPECVLDGETGVLVEPNDEEALVDALITLARQPDRRRALGERARCFVSDRFSMDTVGKSYLGFYDRLLDRQGQAH